MERLLELCRRLKEILTAIFFGDHGERRRLLAPSPPKLRIQPERRRPVGALNPFRYSLSELSKVLIALVGFAGYAVTIFVAVDPGLIGAIEALVVPGVGLVAIFVVGNHTGSEYNKAIVAFLTAALTVYQYFGQLDPGTESKLFVAAGALATALGVFLKGGAPVVEVQTKVAHRTQHRE